WERLRLRTFIPPTFEKGDIKIYVWNIGGEAVFFDDLHITRQKDKKYPTYEGDVLDLEIDSLGMDKIRAVRYTAFIRGTLQSDEWVKAKIKYRGKVMPVKLRLKGDWLDHLQGEKWSFRIKLKKGYAWNRLREFSIQNPATRNFLAEWTLHRLLEKEDVLTTRYGFVPVRLNGKTLGIYAWEEHFVKQLLEARSRKEAPVIRFTEDAFWDWISFMEAKDPVMRYLPKFDAADILPFKQKSTISSPSMKALFITGQNLLWQLKQSSRPVGELINTDALAKYYAITALTCAYHGLAWHNMRFYVNPYTQMLDPIAFDGYPGSSISDDEFERILGFNKEGNCVQELKDREEYMLKGLLNDTVFRKQYESYLDAFSGPAYMDTFMVQIRDDALNYEGLIRREFPSYKYNYSMLKDKAALLRAALATDEQQYCRISYRYAPDTLATDTDYCTLEKPLKSMAVKAFLEHERNGQCTLTLLNYHCRPLKIKGTGTGGLITSRIPVEVVLPPKGPNGQPGPVQIESRAGATQVFYS
ncbi:MAG: CotH kinase family protein, partial [Flavobacteriales bacterium]